MGFQIRTHSQPSTAWVPNGHIAPADSMGSGPADCCKRRQHGFQTAHIRKRRQHGFQIRTHSPAGAKTRCHGCCAAAGWLVFWLLQPSSALRAHPHIRARAHCKATSIGEQVDPVALCGLAIFVRLQLRSGFQLLAGGELRNVGCKPVVTDARGRRGVRSAERNEWWQMRNRARAFDGSHIRQIDFFGFLWLLHGTWAFQRA